jgi:N-acetylneuraminate synthase
MSVIVIAEAGVNHNGDVVLAERLIDAAADAGADFVKFQSFVPAAMTSAGAGKAAYQERDGGADESQRAMLDRLALNRDEEGRLKDYCAKRGVAMLSTPFDMDSLIFVGTTLALPMLKISSGSLTDGPLLLAAARHGLPMILSTGMGNLTDVAEALDLIAWAMTNDGMPTDRTTFQGARLTADGTACLQKKITLLHCTTSYPTPINEVNLKAMDTLAAVFGLPVGYSDHTLGIAVTLAAVARRATVIEKHFTLDRGLPGPDHKASLEPDELKTMVVEIRNVTTALGSADKVPAPSEALNAEIARGSLVTLEAIAAGAPFTPQNLGVKRPGTGLSPMDFWIHLGRAATRAYDADEIVES